MAAFENDKNICISGGKKKPGRPATGRKRNKKLPAMFTEGEVDEIRDGANDSGKTQADFVMDKVRGKCAFENEHKRQIKCGEALKNAKGI